MNDRLVTIFGAFGALLVLVALLVPGGEPPVTRPTTEEQGPNGYAALARWLRDQGVAVESFRERMDTLSADSRKREPTGNVLITTMPHRTRMRGSEIEALVDWVGEGNTVLVLAALDDTPDWALFTEKGFFLDDLKHLSGLRFTAPENDAAREPIGSLLETTTVTLDAIPTHPLMSGVGSLHGVSDSLATRWLPNLEPEGPLVLKLATEAESGVAALWQRRYGNGYIVVSSLGSLLGNRVIGEAGNRRFIANLLAYHVYAGGAVIFDDMHQGLSALYDPDAFFSDARVGVTLLFVLGFWLLYMVGTNNRLVPVVKRERVSSQGDFVSGVGGFLARKLSPAEAGRLMLETWFDELRERAAIPASTGPPWRHIRAMAAADGACIDRLERDHDVLERGGRVDLRTLHNNIEELRRMLR